MQLISSISAIQQNGINCCRNVSILAEPKVAQLWVNCIISSNNAKPSETPSLGSVIGKALEDFDGDLGTIEVIVGRL